MNQRKKLYECKNVKKWTEKVHFSFLDNSWKSWRKSLVVSEKKNATTFFSHIFLETTENLLSLIEKLF
jgi:hypothetical protein